MNIKSTFLMSFCVLCGVSSAFAAGNSLSADSQSIKDKSSVIEKEYSLERRKANNAARPNEAWEGVSPQTATNVESQLRYASTLKMRENRKVGAGISAGGNLGLVGLNVEFNFEDENGVLIGFGSGTGYNSFQLAWKHAFEGPYLAPYVMAGYSRWYNSYGGSGAHQSSDILNRVLTTQEKQEGRFGTDFINASVGVQYNQLSGDLAGVSFYGELIGMTEFKRGVIVPNGAVGLLYYF